MSALHYGRCPGCDATEGFSTKLFRGRDFYYRAFHMACGWRGPKGKSFAAAQQLADREIERAHAAQEVTA